MLVNKDEIAKLVKGRCLGGDEEIVNRLVAEIVADIEPTIYSLVRRVVSQERQNLYENRAPKNIDLRL